MNFTVLATSFNDENNIEKYLNNFEKQTVKPTELLIVDGGSKDSTVKKIEQIAAKYSFKINVVGNIGRLNIAEGYNKAVKRSKTDMVLLTGIGNDYSTNFCESLISYYEKNDVDIVYTPIVGIDQNSFSKAFNIAFVGGKKGKDFGFASNRGVLLNKKVFDKIGYFYDKFVYAGEDTEFFIRAQAAGLKAGYDAKSFVYWETPTSFKEYLKKNKVNAIADMQCFNNNKLLKHMLIRGGIAIGTIVGAVISPWITIALWGIIICAIIWKIKSINIKAILLRIHFIFLPTYYYIRNKKYFAEEYKVKLEG